MVEKLTIEDVGSRIIKNADNQRRVLIALSGFGGSGKSTVAPVLATLLGAAVIGLDDFIESRLDKRSADWDGFDWDRLINQVLLPASQGKAQISWGIYDWAENRVVGEKNINPVPKFLIVEGVGLIREELKQYFDICLWLDVPMEVAHLRAKQRDKDIYGYDHDSIWNERWTPNDRDYFNKHRPDLHADFLIES